MTDYHIGSSRSINDFVADKLRAYADGGFRFETLFELMFRERDNVLYERSAGFRIHKTTYGEARADILRKAGALQSLLPALAPNAVVGLYMENSLEWIEAFWAILAAGFRPLLMNLRLPLPLLRQGMDCCGCAAVITGGRRFDCPTVSADALEAGRGERIERPFGSELLVMSSGTTEHVKVCAYTAEEFYYQILDSYAIIQRCRQIKKHYEGSLKLLTFLPFYHVFGLIAVYIWFTFFSRTLVHLPDFAPQTVVSTIKRHKVTHVFAVPLFWEKVYEQATRAIRERGEKTWNKFQKALALQQRLPEPLAAAFSKTAFREVREQLFGDSISFLISGGSFIDPQILRFFNGIVYPLAIGYGMTEIGITSVELSAKRRWLCAGYVGGPMSNTEYRIDENGELLVRGRTLARYVLTGSERSENDGWFHTNDLAVCVRGHYMLQGRRDDLIISSGGENLNPNLLEPRLQTDGAELCLLGVREGEKTRPVLLVSVSRYITPEKLRALDASLKERIAALGLDGELRRISYTAEPLLQKDEFKRNRLRLARDYAEGSIPLIDPETRQKEAVLDELTRQVLRCFAEALGMQEDELAPEADFFLDLGGTSLDYLTMISSLREEFGLAFPFEDASLRTVRQMTEYIREQHNL